MTHTPHSRFAGRFTTACLILLTMLIPGAPEGLSAQESAFQISDQTPDLPQAAETPTTDSVDAALENLDLRAQIAQLMIITAQGRQRPQVDDLAFLQSHTPGGVVIREVLKQEFTAAYVARLRTVEAISGIPMAVGTNMYWLTRRDRDVTNSFVQLPSVLAVAAANDDRATDSLAELMAQYMRGMGFNFHIGPDLTLAPRLTAAPGDIYNMGSDPEVAAKLGATIMRTFAKYGITPMASGFPGGGANRSGNSPAMLLTSPNVVLQEDLLPYARLVEAGVPAILVDNVLVPTLDPCNCPASVSKEVMQVWLREKLGFKGVIVAGPIDGSVIGAQYDTAEAAVMAMRNGADMLFWQGTSSAVQRGIDRLVLAVELGELDRAAIARSVRRVLELKRQGGQLPGLEIESVESRKLKVKRLEQLTHHVERRSITLVQNKNGVLPLDKNRSMPIGVTGVTGVAELHGFLEKHIKKIAQQAIRTARHTGRLEDFEIERLTGRMDGIRTVVCVLSDDVAVHGQVRLLEAIRSKGAQIVAVLVGYPKQLPEIAAVADAVVLVYSDEVSNYTTMKALADVLVGKGALRILEPEGAAVLRVGDTRAFDVRDVVRTPAGRLPVGVSEVFPAGWSVPCDHTNAIKKVRWDFGNGKNSSKNRAEFSYPAPGTYTVSLSVTDQSGEVTTGSFPVRVE